VLHDHRNPVRDCFLPAGGSRPSPSRQGHRQARTGAGWGRCRGDRVVPRSGSSWAATAQGCLGSCASWPVGVQQAKSAQCHLGPAKPSRWAPRQIVGQRAGQGHWPVPGEQTV